MTEHGPPPASRDDPTAQLVRWGLEAEALSAAAARHGAQLELGLRRSRATVEQALRLLREAAEHLVPGGEQTSRIEEVARSGEDSATRTDLLALNFQVEVARQGEDDRRLEPVAAEIRALADTGARGAAETRELAQALQEELRQSLQMWGRGDAQLDQALEQLERALRTAEETAAALAEARGVSARFQLATRAYQEGSTLTSGLTADALAVAIEARERTAARVVRGLSQRLSETSRRLEQEAGLAAAVAAEVEAFEQRLDDLQELVDGADDMARRAKQLAINADLAASRSRDPAFELFAEEARLLSERAESAAVHAQEQLVKERRSRAPRLEAGHRLTSSLRDHADALRVLLEPLGDAAMEQEGPDGADAGLVQAWRDDRAAEGQVGQALAEWRYARGERGPG
jgi:Methyl-accepting chemotaxis protein (MCP) signalling domain